MRGRPGPSTPLWASYPPRPAPPPPRTWLVPRAEMSRNRPRDDLRRPVLEPEHPDAECPQRTTPPQVVGVPRWVVVDAPVELDGQPLGGAVEVHDVPADAVLTPERAALESAPLKHAPQRSLRRAWRGCGGRTGALSSRPGSRSARSLGGAGFLSGAGWSPGAERRGGAGWSGGPSCSARVDHPRPLLSRRGAASGRTVGGRSRVAGVGRLFRGRRLLGRRFLRSRLLGRPARRGRLSCRLLRPARGGGCRTSSSW